MKTHKFKLGLFLALAISYVGLYGQTSSNTNQKNDKNESYFSLGINYISDAVYFGRKDSISAPYLYPHFTYFNKTGFYLTGSFSYLTKSNESRVDLFLGTVGYEITSKKFSGNISFTKYFFNSDSYNVISEVEADITAMGKYDFNLLYGAVSVTSFFNKSSSSDLFLSTELGHDFVTKSRDFQISPNVAIFFGSQNFYEEYYINNRFGSKRSKGSGQGPGTGTSTTTTTTVILNESEKFGLMAIEFSAPIWYIAKPVTLSFLPVVVIPQNPATLTVDSTVYKEDLETTFYWMVGISYKF